ATPAAQLAGTRRRFSAASNASHPEKLGSTAPASSLVSMSATDQPASSGNDSPGAKSAATSAGSIATGSVVVGTAVGAAVRATLWSTPTAGAAPARPAAAPTRVPPVNWGTGGAV